MTIRQIVGAWTIRTMERLGWVPKKVHEDLQKSVAGDLHIRAPVMVRVSHEGGRTRVLNPGDTCVMTFPKNASFVDVHVIPVAFFEGE